MFAKICARLTKAVGAKPKSANGAVAVGLPHRNRSLFKHAHINKRPEKE